MKTALIKLYKFNELSKELQNKIIQEKYEINLIHDWYEDIYEDFSNVFCPIFGITKVNNISFTGFYDQASGASFNADVDILQLLETIKNKSWNKEYPELNIDFDSAFNFETALNAIRNGSVNIYCAVRKSHKHYLFDYVFDYEVVNKQLQFGYDAKLLHENLNSLEKYFAHAIDVIIKYLFNNLQEEYEFLTSEESVKQSISDDYFYENGNPYENDGTDIDLINVCKKSFDSGINTHYTSKPKDDWEKIKLELKTKYLK